MMVGSKEKAGAVNRETMDWDSIDWTRHQRNVSRLQSRIAKAAKAGKWNKVKALQHLLTHSLGGKALAVKRVTTNKGKNTPGVDKEL
jgi:RNA-directed DNA polymerase